MSVSYKDLLSQEDWLVKLTERLEHFDVLVGYSFGGRLLGELKESGLFHGKTWVFVSSRHSPYSQEQLTEREEFRSKIAHLIQTDLQKFSEFWNALPLFSGHLMSEYREKHRLPYISWSQDEKLDYLEFFFNSKQFLPQKDESVHYIYGERDQKYSDEAERLRNFFKVHSLKEVGHRAPFEDEKQFKSLLKKICQIEEGD